VDDIQLRLGRRDLRRNRWSTAGVGLLCVGLAAAFWWLPDGRTSTHPSPDRVQLLIGVAASWVLLLVYMTNQARGVTCLTADGIRLHSLVTRRLIPWAEVVGFEERRRSNRGGSFWDVRVQRTNGRPLAMPGFFTSGRRDWAFDENLVHLHAYWAAMRSAGSLPPE
jgi:hypothetical protein